MTLSDLLGIISGGASVFKTPPYVPQGPAVPPNIPIGGSPTGGGNSPSGNSSNGGGIDWGAILKAALPAGSGVLATILQNRAQNQQNQRLQQQADLLNKIAQQEQDRRNYYGGILMPSLLQGLGNTDPNVLAMAKQHLQALPGYGGAPLSTATPPTTGTPTTSTTPAVTPTTGGITGTPTTGGNGGAFYGVSRFNPNDPSTWDPSDPAYQRYFNNNPYEGI